MSCNPAEKPVITEADYLTTETLATEKHEYLNGLVYLLHWNSITDMGEATDAHEVGLVGLDVPFSVKKNELC